MGRVGGVVAEPFPPVPDVPTLEHPVPRMSVMSRVFCNFDWALLSSLGACLHQHTRGEEYVERGIETFEQRRVNRTVSNLGRRAQQFGNKLVKVVEDVDVRNPAESVA